MNKIQYKHRLVIVSLLFFVTILVLYNFVFQPTIRDIKKYRETILYQKIELQMKLDRDRNMTKTNSKINEISPHLDKFEEIYIDRNKILEFITTLEGIAAKNNVEQSLDLAIDKANNKNQYSKVPLRMSLQGAYTNLKKYLQDIERQSYYINIDSINMSLLKGTEDGKINKNIPGSLSFDAFVFVK